MGQETGNEARVASERECDMRERMRKKRANEARESE